MKITSDINRVLIAPIDWGLGHATRCVPIINDLIEKGITPVIAAYGAPLKFYRLEFPDVEIIEFPGLQIKYPSKYSLMLKMAVMFPQIVSAFIKEHFMLKQIVEDYKVDAVISDGRFGLWNRKVKSVFVNHQINIKLPGMFSLFEYPLYLLNRLAMSGFDEVWIPDINDKPNLAGELSSKYDLSDRYKYIGPLSRFRNTNKVGDSFSSDILIIISGPEPARTEFEDILLRQFENETKRRIIVVRGKPGDSKTIRELPENVVIHNHLSSEELCSAIHNTKLVISRPGYSTIMDLTKFAKNAIFIPTPGQSEQEYLAAYFKQVRWAPFYNQDEFELRKAVEITNKYSGIPLIKNSLQIRL